MKTDRVAALPVYLILLWLQQFLKKKLVFKKRTLKHENY